MPGDTRTQMRRQVGLETLTLVVHTAAAVSFAGAFCTDWTWRTIIALTCLAGATSTTVWLWHRSKYPPSVELDLAEPTGEEVLEEDDGKWDVMTLALLGLTLAVFVPLATTFQFMLPLSVITAIALIDGGSTLTGFLSAVMSTLAVAFVLEFGVLHPLRKRWHLPWEQKKRRREEFCPTPRDHVTDGMA